MQLIDTHSHIYEEEFDQDIDEVIERLKANSVCEVFLPNIDSSSIERMQRLEEKDPDTFHCMMGLHPTSVNDSYKSELDEVSRRLKQRDYVAIGEIGIDLYWSKDYKKEQVIVFEEQVSMAIERNLPIVIHARNATEEIFESLRKFNPNTLRGIFHSFTGTKEEAETIFTLGDFYLGINGIITFKKSDLPTTITEIPLEKIVLETDAPYLAPVPYRGKRNETSYIIKTAEKIAEVKKITLEEVAKTTTYNAKNIFSIKKCKKKS